MFWIPACLWSPRGGACPFLATDRSRQLHRSERERGEGGEREREKGEGETEREREREKERENNGDHSY